MPDVIAHCFCYWAAVMHPLPACLPAAPQDPDPLPLPGAYLRHVDAFDADFFHVSPQEAAAMGYEQALVSE